jgi:hypothetical protein
MIFSDRLRKWLEDSVGMTEAQEWFAHFRLALENRVPSIVTLVAASGFRYFVDETKPEQKLCMTIMNQSVIHDTFNPVWRNKGEQAVFYLRPSTQLSWNFIPHINPDSEDAKTEETHNEAKNDSDAASNNVLSSQNTNNSNLIENQPSHERVSSHAQSTSFHEVEFHTLLNDSERKYQTAGQSVNEVSRYFPRVYQLSPEQMKEKGKCLIEELRVMLPGFSPHLARRCLYNLDGWIRLPHPLDMLDNNGKLWDMNLPNTNIAVPLVTVGHGSITTESHTEAKIDQIDVLNPHAMSAITHKFRHIRAVTYCHYFYFPMTYEQTSWNVREWFPFLPSAFTSNAFYAWIAKHPHIEYMSHILYNYLSRLSNEDIESKNQDNNNQNNNNNQEESKMSLTTSHSNTLVENTNESKSEINQELVSTDDDVQIISNTRITRTSSQGKNVRSSRMRKRVTRKSSKSNHAGNNVEMMEESSSSSSSSDDTSDEEYKEEDAELEVTLDSEDDSDDESTHDGDDDNSTDDTNLKSLKKKKPRIVPSMSEAQLATARLMIRRKKRFPHRPSQLNTFINQLPAWATHLSVPKISNHSSSSLAVSSSNQVLISSTEHEAFGLSMTANETKVKNEQKNIIVAFDKSLPRMTLDDYNDKYFVAAPSLPDMSIPTQNVSTVIRSNQKKKQKQKRQRRSSGGSNRLCRSSSLFDDEADEDGDDEDDHKADNHDDDDANNDERPVNNNRNSDDDNDDDNPDDDDESNQRNRMKSFTADDIKEIKPDCISQPIPDAYKANIHIDLDQSTIESLKLSYGVMDQSVDAEKSLIQFRKTIDMDGICAVSSIESLYFGLKAHLERMNASLLDSLSYEWVINIGKGSYFKMPKRKSSRIALPNQNFFSSTRDAETKTKLYQMKPVQTMKYNFYLGTFRFGSFQFQMRLLNIQIPSFYRYITIALKRILKKGVSLHQSIRQMVELDKIKLTRGKQNETISFDVFTTLLILKELLNMQKEGEQVWKQLKDKSSEEKEAYLLELSRRDPLAANPTMMSLKQVKFYFFYYGCKNLYSTASFLELSRLQATMNASLPHLAFITFEVDFGMIVTPVSQHNGYLNS